LIKNLRTEHTVIYSTHILSEVAASCDRIIVIDRGKIVAQEAINSMGATGNKTRTELIVQKIDEKLLSSVRNIPGVSKVENISNGSQRLVVESEPTDALMVEIAKVVVGQGAGLVRMTPMQQGLEEYYLNLISGKRSML
jgi:ABC-2 type transport system ATP-binding protein